MHVNIKTVLSHKEWRKLLKKLRRKIVRKKEAEERDKKYEKEQAILRSNPAYLAQLLEEEEIANEIQRREELEAIYRREQWRIRDLALHKNWLFNQEKKKKIDQERKLQEETIRIEWEEKLVIEAAAKKKITESENELLKEASRQLGDNTPIHNPEPPIGYIRPQIKKVEPCPFFAKTGACRFGFNCSRDHTYPMGSKTILLPNMYTHFGLEGAFSDDYDMDISLEYSESDSYSHFREFFFDVLSEFEKCGKVIQFKVCSNKSPHLKGNVYVQFEKVEAAEIAYGMFNGRWYAGRQISCVFVQIEQWKLAICGLHFAMKCPKGDNCNFLHVYRNPGNAFFSADRDWFYDKKAAGTPRSHRRGSESGSSERKENGSSRRRNEDLNRSGSRQRKKRQSSSERLFLGTKPLKNRKSRSRSIDKRKARPNSTETKRISSRRSYKRKSKSRSTDRRKSRSRSTDRRNSRSRSTDRRNSRSRSTDWRKSRSRSKDRRKSRSRSIGQKKSRSSSIGGRKSRSQSTDERISRDRSTDRRKSRSRSSDRRKSRSRSSDRRKSRSRSTGRRKSRSSSTDKRKARNRLTDGRKSRSRSTDKRKSRSKSTDRRKSRSRSTDKRKSRYRSRDKRKLRSNSKDCRKSRSSSTDRRKSRSKCGEQQMKASVKLVKLNKRTKSVEIK